MAAALIAAAAAGVFNAVVVAVRWACEKPRAMFDKTVKTRSGLKVEQVKVGPYLLDFYVGGPQLTVTFEPDEPAIKRDDALRDGWGMAEFAARGWSVLAVKSGNRNWYRGGKLADWFGSPEVAHFLAGFRRVAFVGASMGGYAALTFSRVRPGAVVLAHHPQSTLDPALAGWDGRFPEAAKQNWQGVFGDAATAAPWAQRLYVTFDPFQPEDRRHAARLEAPNTVLLKMPFLGHPTDARLRELGLLEEVTARALDESLTWQRFAVMMRARRRQARYYVIAARRFRQSGFPVATELALRRALKIEPKQEEAKKLLGEIEKRRTARRVARRPGWVRNFVWFGKTVRRLFVTMFLD